MGPAGVSGGSRSPPLRLPVPGPGGCRPASPPRLPPPAGRPSACASGCSTSSERAVRRACGPPKTPLQLAHRRQFLGEVGKAGGRPAGVGSGTRWCETWQTPCTVRASHSPRVATWRRSASTPPAPQGSERTAGTPSSRARRPRISSAERPKRAAVLGLTDRYRPSSPSHSSTPTYSGDWVKRRSQSGSSPRSGATWWRTAGVRGGGNGEGCDISSFDEGRGATALEGRPPPSF